MDVKERIASSGLKDATLAAMCNTHRATVGRWRRGEIKPREADHIANLAKALGCTPADLRPDLAALFSGKDDAA